LHLASRRIPFGKTSVGSWSRTCRWRVRELDWYMS
jgi:hypothetical protein